MPGLKKSLGWQYIQQSKFSRSSIYSISRLKIAPEAIFKIYTDSKLYSLPEPVNKNIDFLTLISSRKSHRDFLNKEITLNELSTILWCGYGIREKKGNFFFRNVPSAGALYPLEIYLMTFNVSGLPKGIFHYFPKNHSLELLKEGDFSKELIQASLAQNFVSKGAVTILITSIFRRNMAKYGHRGLRYILLDAGHLAQNMVLGAETLSIGCCPVGAFFDDEINTLIGVDGIEESTLYLLVFGKKSEES